MGKRKRIKVQGVKILQTLKKEKKTYEKNDSTILESLPREKDVIEAEKLVGVCYESFIG